MDTVILQLDCRVFRLVSFHVRRTTGIAPEVLLPPEIVTLITRAKEPPPARSPSVFPVPL
jgi:hypothetical protein